MNPVLPTRFAAFAFAVASQTPACNDLSCRLGAWLHVLYALAAFLGIIFLITAAIALQSYRQNKKAKLLPE